MRDCPTDLNADRLTDLRDLQIVLGGLGHCGTGFCLSDVNGDRVTDLADLRETLGAFGRCRDE